MANHFPELAPRLPRFRKPWMSEDYRMSIFDAIAFGRVPQCKALMDSDPNVTDL